MQSLLFGLIAALCWGLHDFLVRNVSQRADVAPLMAVVLVIGAIVLAPLTVVFGNWGDMGLRAVAAASASGLSFVIAGVGLYKAFRIGPVRLVAPICGAYPVLSVGLAVWQGQPVPVLRWLAVLAVVGGIALVARQPDTAPGQHRAEAILWAVMAALGFAFTFHLGQIAAQAGSDLPATLVARLAAIAVVAVWMLARRAALAPAMVHVRTLALMGVLDVTALGFVLAAGSLPNPEFAAISSASFGIVTILLAWRFIGEAMRPLQWLGVGVVFAGIGYLAAA